MLACRQPSSRKGGGGIIGRGRGVPDLPVEGSVEGVAIFVRFVGGVPPGVSVNAVPIDIPGKRDAAERQNSLA